MEKVLAFLPDTTYFLSIRTPYATVWLPRVQVDGYLATMKFSELVEQLAREACIVNHSIGN